VISGGGFFTRFSTFTHLPSALRISPFAHLRCNFGAGATGVTFFGFGAVAFAGACSGQRERSLGSTGVGQH
jgi:hypothetical protein